MRDLVFARRVAGGFTPATENDHAAFENIPIGEVVALKLARGRSLPQMRLFWALLEHVATASRFESERLLVALKIRLGRYDLLKMPNGKVVPVPHSISFGMMPQDDFQKFMDDSVQLICTEVLEGYDAGTLIREIEELLGTPHKPPAPDDPAQSPAAIRPADPPAAGGSPSRPRGRPPGSRNKPAHEDTAAGGPAAVDPPETPADDPEPAAEEHISDPVPTGDPDVLVEFNAQTNIKEWFGRGRQRLRDMQAAGSDPKRFIAYRKANAAALERLRRELLSWWQQLDQIIKDGERRVEP